VATSDRDLDVRLLGPVEVHLGERRLEIGGKRQRRLLVLLALDAGTVVPSDRLIDQLAGADGPDVTAASLKVQVSRLRKALGPAATLTGSRAGYRLDLPVDAADVARFQRQVASAREHGAVRPQRARTAAAAALALWRGEPFGGAGGSGDSPEAGPGDALAGPAARLHELRLEALELRIGADLALGAAAEVVPELEALVAAHPYRERLWRHLMLALYRADRQADALAAYHRARKALDDELGIEPGDELVALEAAILRHEVEPPAPLERRQNLPAATTSFVGRATELAELKTIVGRSRLVTLTGVGGVGKTRLGLELARCSIGEADGGVWFIDLARLAEPELVPAEVAAALAVPEDATRTPTERLVGHLRDRDAVLLLDNCEHLVAACASLVGRLLETCPSVRVLATSRVPLGVGGETTYPVPPMSMGTTASDAEALFLERARTASPGLTMRSDDAAVIERICRDLDGLPLAIELAAARVRSLALPDIADRLRGRFRFLVSWRRVSEARHRTLREAIDWSYELLQPAEARLLEKLSVFAGGFDLEAATVVGGEDEADTLDSLERLIDASLVVPSVEAAGPRRFRLLETVRQHGAERLAAAHEDEATRARHADHYAEVATSLNISFLEGEEERLAIERLGIERDNIRAALSWFAEHGRWPDLLRMSDSLWRYWWVRGEAVEGRSWLERTVALRDAEPSPAPNGDELTRLGNLLRGLAALTWSRGDFDAARAAALRAEEIFRELGDDVGAGRTWNTIGVIEHGRRNMADATTAFERSIELLRSADIEPVLRAQLLATSTDNLGSALLELGDTARAIELYREARTLHATEGKGSETALMDLHLGRAAVTAGDLDEAPPLLATALAHYSELGFVQYMTECLESIGWLATARGDDTTAATLLGAAGLLREQTGTLYWGHTEEQLFHYLAISRGRLGDAAFGAAWEAGRAAPDAAVQRALAWLGTPIAQGAAAV
jgi:predicted ATPase/DNA-binding SARP family transcriptional activator